MDTLGCGLLALRFPECTKHLGPIVEESFVHYCSVSLNRRITVKNLYIALSYSQAECTRLSLNIICNYLN
jgi:hypothetical protein